MWGGFAQANWAPSGSRWGVDFGARYDPTRSTARAFEPRATLFFYPSRGWTLRLLAGRTFRPPTPIFSEVCCGQTLLPELRGGRHRRNGLDLRLRGNLPAEPERSGSRSTWPRPTSTTTSCASRRRASSTSRPTPTPTSRAPARRLRRSWPAGRRSRALTFDASYGILDFREHRRRAVTIRYSPFSSGSSADRTIPIDQIPYRPEDTGSFGVNWTVGARRQRPAAGDIHRSAVDPAIRIPRAAAESRLDDLLLNDMREVPGLLAGQFLARRAALAGLRGRRRDRQHQRLCPGGPGRPDARLQLGPADRDLLLVGVRIALNR